MTTTRPLTKFLVLLSGWDCVKKEYPKIVAGRNLRHDSIYPLFRYLDALQGFESLDEYRDAQEMLRQCRILREEAVREHERIYQENSRCLAESSDLQALLKAAEQLAALGNFKDSRELSDRCRYKAEQRKLALRIEHHRQIKPLQQLLWVGDGYILALKSDGTVLMTQDGKHGWLDRVKLWKNIKKIYVEENEYNACTVGLKSDGTVVAVGDNACGECNVSDWKDVKLPN